METFRNNNTETSGERPGSFVGRTTAENSPSAIIAGLVLHGSRQMGKQIKPAAFKRMDPVVSIALQCDMTGTDSDIRARMEAAGLTGAEVENLWAVSETSFKAARKNQTDRHYKLSSEDADIKAFFAAQNELIGFLKED